MTAKGALAKADGPKHDGTPPNCWIFQFRKADDISSIQEGDELRWQAHNKIRKGDNVVLWKSGDDAGIFGLGKVLIDPIRQPFFGKPLSLRFKVSRRFEEVLPRQELREDRFFRKSTVIAGSSFGAGITPVSFAQFDRLAAVLRRARAGGYWIFQANPRTGDDLRELLISEPESGWWRLTRFHDPRNHIRIGDRIVLWQVEGGEPAAAGVYAIGEISKAPVRVRGEWRGYYRLSMARDPDNPISAKLLRSDPILREISAFGKRPAQGSNFRINRKQWLTIESYFTREVKAKVHTAIIEPTQQNAQILYRVPVRGVAEREMELRERLLVGDYQRYMARNGCRPLPYMIRLTGENPIVCDLYDERRGTLIEAKGIATRESVRMAIGQLADYMRFIKPPPSLAVLLPSRPRHDLELLLNSQKIHTIWRTEEGEFADNSASHRFTNR